jgi:tetratricopeptide (TPR) repeat protein/lambda repressor-like predicted transcriptional regulator
VDDVRAGKNSGRDRTKSDGGGLREGFAAALDDLVNGSGHSLRTLGKKTGLAKSTIADALRGKHFPRLETVLKIVAACAGDETWWRAEWARVNVAPVDGERGKSAVPGWRHPVPRQLPAVADLVGRTRELAALTDQLDNADAGAGPVSITAISGMAGVGKTALALWWGAQVRERFPDGQLYLDLQGYGPGEPRQPDAALALALGSLGVPNAQIPGEEDERATLYRSLLADKKVLVVLDNAVSAEQVRPLVPASPGCVVVVTSRKELPSLVAGHGARRLPLDRLTEAEAVDLLGRVVGQDNTAAESGAAVEIARRCGCLPLALRVAGAHSAAGLSLAEIAEQLASARLDLLATADDDRTTNVRSVFSWSYHALPAEEARMFRLLGLHTGPDISVAAAAALAGLTTSAAARLLDGLTAANLVERTGKDRYRCHDLLHDYAREQAAADETAEDRDAAVRRVLDLYLHGADAADRVLSPHRLRAPVDPRDPGVPPLAFAGYDEALAWFDDERANLTAAARQAVAAGLPGTAWKIASAMSVYCFVRKPWPEWLASHETGLAAALRAGDPFGEAALRTGLGAAEYDRKRYEHAVDHLVRAQALWQRLDNLWGEAIAVNIMGSAYRDLGRYPDAVRCFRRALDIWPTIDAVWGKGVTLHNLGTTYRELGQPDDAVTWLTDSIAVRRELPDRYGEAWARHDLGVVHGECGRPGEAAAELRRALAIRHEIGDRHGAAQTLLELATLAQETGEPGTAAEHLRAALTIFTDLHDPRAEEVRARLG